MLPAALAAVAFVEHGIVYEGATPGSVVALEARDGHALWRALGANRGSD
jgi:hypothetical protein